MSQARSMRLAKSEELPGESTVEAMGATSRSPGARGEGPGKGFLELPGGASWRGNGAKAPARAPQVVAGVCIDRTASASGRRGAGRRKNGGWGRRGVRRGSGSVGLLWTKRVVTGLKSSHGPSLTGGAKDCGGTVTGRL
jgi:hypothetical protein